jgi:hypothetical protein
MLSAFAQTTMTRTALAGVAGANEPLPHLEEIQAAFGAHDIGHVRAAIGGDADHAAAAINARAYAVGDRVAFRSAPDLHLAAHEATHVVQQQAGIARSDGMDHPGDELEQQADAVADAVVAGRSVEGLLGALRSAAAAPQLQRACECGTCAACVVQRARDENAAALAPTPGGLRIGALDSSNYQPMFDTVLPSVQKIDLPDLEDKYRRTWNRSLEPAEKLYTNAIYQALANAKSDIETRINDPARKAAVLDTFFKDAAVVFARAFLQPKLDAAAITKDVTDISDTYRRLVDIYNQDRVVRPPQVDPAAAALESDFERRAQVFYEFAKLKLGAPSVGLARVQQGLAADLARLAAGEFANERGVKVLAPDRGAELVVYELLGDPPQLDTLVELFLKVAGEAARGAAGSAAALLDLMFRRYADDLIKKPVGQQLADAGAKGPDIRAQKRRELAIALGRYLARLQPANVVFTTGWFISVLVQYGAPLPREVEDQKNRAETDEIERAAPRAPTPQAPAAPTPTVHRCAATYDLAHVEAYFDARVGVKKGAAKRDVRFDPALVLCQFRGSHSDALLAATSQHLAEWQAGAERIADAMRKEFALALRNDLEIGRLRAAISRDKVEPQDVPDLVKELKPASDFWFRLSQVPYEGNFDTTDLEEHYDALAIPYFFALRRYQQQLLDGLKLIRDVEHERLDVFLQERYRESHALTFQIRRHDLLTIVRWPAPQRDELSDSDGMEIQLQKLRLVIEAARQDRRAERRLELEKEIYARIDWTVRGMRSRLGGHDVLEVNEVFEAMGLTIAKEDTETVKEIIAAALGDVHRARYAELHGEAQAALVIGDTKKAAQDARRMIELRTRLDLPVTEAQPEGILEAVRGQTTNLIGIFAMVQNSLAVGEGAMRAHTPGGVIRAANLLRMALDDGKQATLAEAYTWVKQNEVNLNIAASEKDGRKKVMEDSNKGWRDSLDEWAAKKLGGSAWGYFVQDAINILDESRRSGALLYLINAENAHSDDKRKDSIAALAEMMGSKGPSHSRAVGQFIYSYLLGAVTELQDASEQIHQEKEAAKQAKEQLDKQADYDKKHPDVVKTTEQQKQEAAWRDAIAKVADVGSGIGGVGPEITRQKKQDENIIKVFERGKHPLQKNRDLTKKEKKWFQRWKDLKSDKGWAELREFGEGLLEAFAIGLVTGGIGELFVAGAELSAFARTGVKLAEMAAFTETMRVLQEFHSGERPAGSFAGELVVNLVMHGVGKFAAGRMARALNRQGIPLLGLRGRLNMFVTEYLAASGVGIAHMYVGALIDHGVVTASDIKQNLLSNFGFVVGMKGLHAFVEVPKLAFENEAKTWKDRVIADRYTAALEAVKFYDEAVKAKLEKIAKAKTPQERKALLDDQAGLLEQKAKAIERSNIPDAKKVADDLRAGIAAFRADAKRAVVLETVGAKPLDDATPHLSYDKGSANQAALEKLFKESDTNYKVIERADGSRVYEVQTAEGVLRYEPREPESGGSQREAYSKTTRLEGEAVPGKKTNATQVETGADVAAILRSTSARAEQIPANVGAAFELRTTAGKCQVSLEASARIESSSDHAAGPATYTLKMTKSGEWVAEVTVRKSAPNDHIVRGVNHEVVELGKVIERLEARAKGLKGGRDAYKDPKTLARALAEETSASKDPKKISSHELANIDGDVQTLVKQMAEVQTELGNLGPGDPRRTLLEERRELLLKDAGAVWTMLELPLDKTKFEKRTAELEKLIKPASLLALKSLRITSESTARVDIADLQIIFNELKKANPNLVPEGSFLGMKVYYEEKVRTRVEEAIAKVRKRGGSEQQARAAGVIAAREGLMHGTSIASWRGRAYEGLLIEAFNNNAVLVTAYGRLYQIELNNFPTYDLVGIKLGDGKAAMGVKGVATPLQFDVETVKAKGAEVKVLVVKDANGKEVARQEPDGTMTIHRKGLEVWLASLKAKDRAEVTEMKKAIGTAEKPTGQVMYVTPEYLESLDGKIDFARDKLNRLKRDGARKSDISAARRRLDMLEFFKKHIRVLDDLTNQRIDTLLKLLKEQGIDTDEILNDALNKKKGTK